MFQEDINLVHAIARKIAQEEIAKIAQPEPKAEPVVIPAVEPPAVEEVFTRKHKL